MLTEVSTEKIKAAIGKHIRVVAFGIPYEGILKAFDETASRLLIKDKRDEVLIEQERIESFKVLHP